MRSRHLLVDATPSRRDPTGTGATRKRFEAEAVRRFSALRKLVLEAILRSDVLGLGKNQNSLGSFLATRDQASSPPPGAFAFERSGDKVAAFGDWLREAASQEILGVQFGTPVRSAAQQSWANQYITTAYQQGLTQAGAQMSKAGVVAPDVTSAAFLQPVHADRVGLAFTRTYEALAGVTSEMAKQMSASLAQSIAEGLGPQAAARELVDRLDKIGITRARVIARTETISAHAEASLNAYAEAGLEGVEVMAEWATAGDDQVCPECAEMEGRQFSIEDSRGMVPAHPNCRCAFLPVV